MNIIETHDLSHAYKRTEAVKSLNLSVPRGSACALLGPNGAGKTTTLKLLMNLLRPSSGSATVLGVDTRKLGPAQFEQIAYVSENQRLPAGMTVRSFLDYCRSFYPKWDRDLEKRLLSIFELPSDRKLKHLSRGMLMKAMLLSSFAYRPTLIILDEPFSGLDPVVREQLTHGILELAGSGDWSMLISSHDIDDVERLIDTACLINSGRHLLSEPLESLQNRFRRAEIYFADATRPTLPATCIAQEQSAQSARWIETAFSHQTEQTYHTLFPKSAITLLPMTLKEIYIAIMKNTRVANTTEAQT